ncbi:hypothetical protein ACQK5W_16145 [Pantoea sp. FN060301]|uniref:hypothetical protein n=1 Tax=Pantoea sp. FN060301 TaxID=3420380 RepID=UPI003D173DB6
MIPEVICRWLAKNARRQHLGERFEQNYLQLMRQPEEHYNDTLFVDNLREKLRLLVTLKSLPPARWARYMTPAAEQEVLRWVRETRLFERRCIVPLLRWNGLPLVLAKMMQIAPDGYDFMFITCDDRWQPLKMMRPVQGGGLLSSRPMMVLVFIDERLPASFLQPVILNGNRLLITDVSPLVLQRLHLEIQTLLPVGSPLGSFHLTGENLPADGWTQAVQDNFTHLARNPVCWGQWDDISVLLHG